MPSNTLLEPNNVIPSWEFGDEENKEVSATLRRIRQKYDNIHKKVLERDRELELKKKELEQAKNDEANIEQRVFEKESGLQQTSTELESIKDSHDFKLMEQRQYQHMIKRMKADLIACQKQSNELQESLKSKTQIYTDEADKNRQAKQQRLQAQHRLEELMRLID